MSNTHYIFAIDPGDQESGWMSYNRLRRKPEHWAKESNGMVLQRIEEFGVGSCGIEMIASYGMAVGQTVFDTCLWAGRFYEHWVMTHSGDSPTLVFRREVKLHLCGKSTAKDTNIRQAIMDRYGGTRQEAVGVKAAPGPLYGVKTDVWAALGVAITAAEVKLNMPKSL